MRKEKEGYSRRSSRLASRKKDRNTKAPLLLRVIAWFALAVIMFSIGHLGSGWLLNYFDNKGVGSQPDVVSTVEQAKNVISSGKDVQKLVDMGKHVMFSLYVFQKDSGKLKLEKIKVTSGLMEEDLQRVMDDLLEKLVKSGVFAGDVRLLHIFRNGEMVYLDFNQAFYITLSKLSLKRGSMLMTGLVKTVVANFVPIGRVQFLVDGKVVGKAGEIPLSAPWKLKKKS